MYYPHEDEPRMTPEEMDAMREPYFPRVIPQSVLAPLRAAVVDAMALDESEEPFNMTLRA